MALRDNPYGAFNFMVKLGRHRRRGPDRRRLLRRQRARQRGQVLRVPQRQRRGEPRPQDRQHQQHRRRDAQARRDRRPAPVQLAARPPARATSSPRTVTITLLDERRAAGVPWVLTSAQPKKWVGPDAGGQGRRRGGDGGTAPGRRADRLRVGLARPGGRGDVRGLQPRRARGLPGAPWPPPPAPARCRSGWTSPVSSAWPGAARWTSRCW